MRLAAYITNHGFGHATRSFQVFRALAERCPELIIRTNAPKQLLEYHGGFQYEHVDVKLDVGAVDDGLTVDSGATLRAWNELMETLPQTIASEAKALQDWQADLVYFDIPPTAPLIAKAAGLPSVALGNFTWDFIYTDLARREPKLFAAVQWMQDAYRQTTLCLQTPLGHELTAFPQRQTIPIVTKTSAYTRQQVRQDLALDDDQPLVLIALRPDVLCPVLPSLHSDRIRYLIVGPEDPNDPAAVHRLGHQWQERFTDLIVVSDAVLSKPGYGIVGECIANNRPLLHLPRFGFAETKPLLDDMDKYMRHQSISSDQPSSEELERAFHFVMAKEVSSLQAVGTNGAEVAASILENVYTKESKR